MILDPLEEYIVRVGGVSHGVGATQKHLERDVWHELSQTLQALPRTLVQEAQTHVKCGTYTYSDREAGKIRLHIVTGWQGKPGFT